MSRFLSILVLCAFLFDTCPAKPTQRLESPPSLNPVDQHAVAPLGLDNKRDQRSPQFGFPGEGFGPFGSGPEFDDDRRYGYKHHHKHHHRPGGCRQFGCGGFGPGGYYPPPPPVFGGAGEASASASAGSAGLGGLGGLGGGEGSFASANAGSNEGNARPFGPFGPVGGGESQANAQSASFNFGPFGSASFSVAEASSAGQQF